MGQHKQIPLLAGNVLGTPDDSFVIAEWQDEGGPPGKPRYIAPLHLHHRDDEAWYVLEGGLCVEMDGEVVELRAGSAVLVRRGVKHTYWNPGPGRVRYLLVMPPRIDALIKAIHSLADKSPAVLKELFRKYDSEFLG